MAQQGKPITDETIERIRKLADAGSTPVQIAITADVSVMTVYKYAGDIIQARKVA